MITHKAFRTLFADHFAEMRIAYQSDGEAVASFHVFRDVYVLIGHYGMRYIIISAHHQSGGDDQQEHVVKAFQTQASGGDPSRRRRSVAVHASHGPALQSGYQLLDE